MRVRSALSLAAVLVSIFASSVAAPTVAAQDHIATAPLDDGNLVPSWFGEGLAFRETEEIDYLWVKPGFSFQGQTLHFVDWPEPELLGDTADERDENDRRLARQMSSDMAKSFADVFGRELRGKVDTSLESGDIKVEGRIVDCSTGSAAAKAFVGFGAGAGNTTIDLRFKDAQSGELLMAMHHRVTSGTNWSTTDSKFFKWVGKAAEEMAQEGLQRLYEKGKPQKE